MTTEERLEKLEKELMRQRWLNLRLLAALGLFVTAWIAVGVLVQPPTIKGAISPRHCRGNN